METTTYTISIQPEDIIPARDIHPFDRRRECPVARAIRRRTGGMVEVDRGEIIVEGGYGCQYRFYPSPDMDEWIRRWNSGERVEAATLDYRAASVLDD